VKRRALKVLFSAARIYLCVALILFLLQRYLVFPAPRGSRPPAGSVVTGPGFRALWTPPPPGGPVVVHFHGNGEDLADLGAIVDLFVTAGAGALAVEYPGYGISRADGASTESSVYAAGAAALEYLRSQGYADVVLAGQSLGTGVAAELASRGLGSRLVLVSPFTSLVAVAGSHYPWLPVHLLLRDRFDTASKAPRIAVAVLLLHGSDDEIVPASMSGELERLFPHASRVVIQGAHHNDLLWSHRDELRGAIAGFLRQTAPGYSSRDKSK